MRKLPPMPPNALQDPGIALTEPLLPDDPAYEFHEDANHWNDCTPHEPLPMDAVIPRPVPMFKTGREYAEALLNYAEGLPELPKGKKKMTYTVKAIDNFPWPPEEFTVATFDTLEEALTRARAEVDEMTPTFVYDEANELVERFDP